MTWKTRKCIKCSTLTWSSSQATCICIPCGGPEVKNSKIKENKF